MDKINSKLIKIAWLINKADWLMYVCGVQINERKKKLHVIILNEPLNQCQDNHNIELYYFDGCQYTVSICSTNESIKTIKTNRNW